MRPGIETVESRILMATLAVPSAYPTITAAVNYANAHPDPSNTVLVSPGTYVEPNITISSPLTLISTNGSGSTTIDGGNNSTEPAPGVVRVTGTSGAVTIGLPGQGFTFQNPVIDQGDGSRALLEVDGNSAPVTIQNDVFTGLNGVGNPFDVGIHVFGSLPGGSVAVQNNTFQKMWQGVLDEVPRGGGSISNNTFQNLQPSTFGTAVYEPEGIFALTYGGTANNISGLSIVGNNFANFDGLAINVSGGYQGQTPSQFSNVLISSNVITSIGFAAQQFRAGITLIDDADTAAQESQGGVINSSVIDNYLQAQTPCSSGSIGVWVLGEDNNISVQNNYIQNLDHGVALGEQVTGAGYPSGLVVNQNSMTGNNIGVYNPSSNSVDASNNYWGTTDATSVKAQANGGVNVSYNPWLGDSTDTSPTPGFQPNLTPAYTDTIQTTSSNGSDSVQYNHPYTIQITQNPNDPHIGTISSYTINWGDGSTTNVSGSTSFVSHTYGPGNTPTQTTYTISATATNTSSQTFQVANTLRVTATVYSTLLVTSFTPTSSGFAVRFSDPINTSVLNLYTGVDSTTSNAGSPDVTLTGPNGNINGSLKLDSDNRGFTFVKTGAPLTAGTYNVTLVSGSSSIEDANTTGSYLDGAGTGSAAATNYTTSFSIASPQNATLSIPDFARGPNQPVNVPAASGIGLPIQITNGSGDTSVMVVLNYDPNLLTITGETLASGLPAGSQFVVNSTIPGRLSICVQLASPLTSSTTQDLIRLIAYVPSTATYRSKADLQLSVTSINGTSGVGQGDSSIGIVTFLGDSSADGSYGSNDTTRIQQVLAGVVTPLGFTSTGFGRYPLVDPAIIGDIVANGYTTGTSTPGTSVLSSLDTSRLRQYLNGSILSPQIPAYTGVSNGYASGPDPKIFIPRTEAGSPGQSLTVPVEFLQTNNAPIDLQSIQLVLAYDPTAMLASNVSLGSLPSGFHLASAIDQAHGRIYVRAYSDTPMTLDPGTLGHLIEVNFTILAGARSGSSVIRILPNGSGNTSSLNEGGLTLVPAPTDAVDSAIDGLITIDSRLLPPHAGIPIAPVASLKVSSGSIVRSSTASEASALDARDFVIDFLTPNLIAGPNPPSTAKQAPVSSTDAIGKSVTISIGGQTPSGRVVSSTRRVVFWNKDFGSFLVPSDASK